MEDLTLFLDLSQSKLQNQRVFLIYSTILGLQKFSEVSIIGSN